MIYFIPARKGSQRLPGKNTALLGGKPLVSWTFDVAASRGGDVIVSSDDGDVLDMARKRGFVAIRRPPELCTSEARMDDVLMHHSSAFKDSDICVLYPTSPFRSAEDVAAAEAKYKRIQDFNFGGVHVMVMGACAVSYRPKGLMTAEEGGRLHLNRPDFSMFYQAQGQPPDYRANGAVYVTSARTIREGALDAQLFAEYTYAHVMDCWSSHEIDTPEDLRLAEAMLEAGVVRC